MLKKRIVPCLDVRDGRVVKGVRFEGLRDAGDPAELGRLYARQGADELVFLDITATRRSERTAVRLAELAKAAGAKRFVFSSSCSNYGAGVDDELTEESSFNPVTPYGRSKVDVELEVGQLADMALDGHLGRRR